jgi:hypothetical protein
MSGALRRTLRSVLLALAISFAVGLAAGTWLRCRMERPPTYIGQSDALRPSAAECAPADRVSAS